MKLKKIISLVLLSALVSSSLTLGNVSAAATYSSSTSFAANYSGDELQFNADNTSIKRRSGYGSGVGRDFYYGSYGSFKYNCDNLGSTLQEKADKNAAAIAKNTTSTTSKGWLRTRASVELTSDSNVGTCNAYVIDYYANSIDLGESSRTTKGDSLKKGFTITNNLQTSIEKLSDYKMKLVTTLVVYDEGKQVASLKSGETYNLSAKKYVKLVTIDADNLSYKIYLTSKTVSKSSSSDTTSSSSSKKSNKSSNSSSSSKKTSDKDVQTDDKSNTTLELVFAGSGCLLIVCMIYMIVRRKED